MLEQAFFKKIIRSAPIGIITTDLERRVTFINDHAQQICRRPNEPLGVPVEKLVADPEAMRADLRKVLSGQELRIALEAHVETDTGARVIEMAATLLRDEANAPIGLLLTCADVTDKREQLEQRIAETKNLKGLGLLAGGIAHDFNNLLSGVMGYASLLKAKLDPETAAFGFAEQIEASAGHAKELTAQLLAFARGGQYEVRSLNLNQTVLEAVHLLRVTMPRTVKLVTHLTSRLSRVEADPTQMHQVITNLFANAIEAMPSGGRITIRTENTTLDGEAAAEALQLDPGPYVHLAMSDTGRGIPPKELPKIFEPFYSTKGVGYGLGLSAAYGIVHNHHGAVTAESTLGEGTTMHVYLPASAATPSPQPPRKTQRLRGSETILVVDDEAIIRNLLNHVLGDLGYTVLLAGDGEAALEIFRKQPRAIHCVILDMVLPNMDGAEVYAAMRELDSGVRVILCTGYSLRGTVEEMLKAGVAGVLRKPFQIEELSAVLRSVLDKPVPATPR